jgi:formylglycine-generating enzyme
MSTTPPPNIYPINAYEAKLPHHDMLWIEGGTFMMGGSDDESSADEKPIHKVTLPSFYLGKYPVTQALYLSIMEIENPANFKGDNRPAEQVSWDDAKIFIEKLNEKTGRKNSKWKYCLPSEAQWEYAARGGELGAKQQFKYAGSNKIKELGWFYTNSHQETKPVGLKIPNQLWLFDMTGNVWEWCEDDWHGTYENAPIDSTPWVDNPRGSYRVYRGGSWSGLARGCRVAFRDYWQPDDRFDALGFRLCLSCPQ